MRRIALLAGFSLLFTSPATAALKQGAKAPVFETDAALAGKPYRFALAKALKKGPVVLYFFPAAFTPGCTMEAHEFAEATPAFAKMGATVIGLASDDISKLTKFSVEECRNAFAVGVATPPIIKGYDVAIPLAARTARVSYVIAPNGQVIHAYANGDYREHVKGTMAAVKAWRVGAKKGGR